MMVAHKDLCHLPTQRQRPMPHRKKGKTDMKLNDLIINKKSLGNRLWLVAVAPAYEYQNNKRTDTILGYRYTVALPDKGLDKVDVRIEGQQQMEAPNGYEEVIFDNLEVFLYWSRGDYHVGAKATGIHLANHKA